MFCEIMYASEIRSLTKRDDGGLIILLPYSCLNRCKYFLELRQQKSGLCGKFEHCFSGFLHFSAA